jgi:hypothetical protein
VEPKRAAQYLRKPLRNCQKIEERLIVLSAGLCDAFDFVAFGDACAFDVFVCCEDKLVCECFLDAAWVVYACGSCAFAYVAYGEVDSALRCDVDG